MTERYHPLYNKIQVRQAIGRMASEITGLHQDDDPLFVSLLRGGAPFLSQLMFEITRQAPDFHPEVDYMVTSHDRDKIVPDSAIPDVKLELDADTRVKDRLVVVVDNLLDKGDTYAFVRNLLRKRGAAAVELAVLLERTYPRTNGADATFAGFRDVPAGFLVGMGMVDKTVSKEAGRWDETIWRVGTQDDLPPQLAEPTAPLLTV